MSAAESASFRPRVLAFCCLYCAYAAADVAGVMHRPYPESVRLVRVPCAGRVDTLDLLRAFESGLDGVLVIGCLEGQCHYRQGNQRAERTVARVRTLLDQAGLGAGRLEFHNVAAAMGPQFADILAAAVEHIRSLGPSPIGRRDRLPGEERVLLGSVQR